jgi:hypothetical protein
MICAQFYPGQGLGNQLWLYATLRTLASKRGLDFGVVNPHYFKALHFMHLDFGKSIQLPINADPNDPNVIPLDFKNVFNEFRKIDEETGLDVSIYDPKLASIEDWTKIEGNFQDPHYLRGFKEEIRTWFKCEIRSEISDLLDDNTCVINFRGGEYRHLKNIFLKRRYWQSARQYMKARNPNVKFLVVTDDVKLAKYFFPASEILDCDIQDDYTLILQARYLILSNSSFCWFPAWLNHEVEICVAPLYWWGNTVGKFWACGNTREKSWIYMSKIGSVEGQNGIPAIQRIRLWFRGGRLLSFASALKYENRHLFLGILGYLPSRRKSRTLVWAKIILSKIVPERLSNFFWNQVINLKKNFPYSMHEIPVLRFSRNKVPENIIVDAFYFNDELDIAELRMQILYPHVDKFIVLESTHTFTGARKALHFRKNLQRYSEFLDKIEVITLDLPIFTRQEFLATLYERNTDLVMRQIIASALNDQNVPPGDSQWLREYLNKEYLKIAFVNLPPDSRVVVSDVDEIWNPKKLPTNYPKSMVLIYKQKPYVYFLNLNSNESWHNWSGSVTATASVIRRKGIASIRVHNRIKRRVISAGGWHFSFQGGIPKILSKLDSYGHQELNTPQNRQRIALGFDEIFDLRGIGASFTVDESGLPPEVMALKSIKPGFFLDKSYQSNREEDS